MLRSQPYPMPAAAFPEAAMCPIDIGLLVSTNQLLCRQSLPHVSAFQSASFALLPEIPSLVSQQARSRPLPTCVGNPQSPRQSCRAKCAYGDLNGPCRSWHYFLLGLFHTVCGFKREGSPWRQTVWPCREIHPRSSLPPAPFWGLYGCSQFDCAARTRG